MSASTSGAAWIYTSFGGVSVGWHLVGGISEASPIFSGIVALADQAAGHRLGLINPALYIMGPASSCLAYRLIQPVTMGAWSEPSRQRRLIWPDGMSSALNRPSVSASTVVTPWPCLMSTTADCRGMSCPIRRR
jgi:subtilase family serine protease